MNESKNALKKNGPSPLSKGNIKRNTNQYRNNNQNTEYYHFVKTAHFQSCIEGIFGATHISTLFLTKLPSVFKPLKLKSELLWK
jgi:hypothetical protein